jgi:DNA-binding CsgD family transcriptional regulator
MTATPATPLGKALAASVAAVAILNTLSALSLPVRARKPDPVMVFVWLALLILHALLYWFGERIRQRFDLRVYAGAQGATLFAITVTDAPVPVALGLLMAFTAELVILAGARWGTIRITLGAIALFVLASLITRDLYRASTAGLLLAITGVLAHAGAALLRRRSESVAAVPVTPSVSVVAAANLSPRETEVLKELVSGARSSDIAAKLGISERTVKAHLANIYQKLGVESRSAAVATAVQRRLV